MPIYEYCCKKCKKQEEHFQWHFNDPSPECHGRMTKVPSVAVAHFYGAGCYEVDYGKMWRNKDGKAFRQHHEGEIPRKVNDPSPEAVEQRKEWG